MVIFSTICFWAPLSEAGELVKMFYQESTHLLFIFQCYYRLLLLCHPFIDSSIYCHWWLKSLSLTYPFQLPSRSVAVTLKYSHMNQHPFQHTHCTVFHLPSWNQLTFPCPFGSFCSSEFTLFLTTSINSDSGRFCLFTNNASSRPLSDLMNLKRVDEGKS